MSKTDAIRAMKLARLESQRTSAPAPAARPASRAAAPARAAVATTAAASVPSAVSEDLVPEALCGHTAISGRRCTRLQGHAEKNHRYAA